MSRLLPFIGTMRIVLNVEDELDAHLTMDRLRMECESLLDEEDGDEVLLTQIIPFTTEVAPEETLAILKRARNALIRTRVKSCYDIAGWLDQEIVALHQQLDPEYSAKYDYGRIMDFGIRIWNNHEEPNE